MTKYKIIGITNLFFGLAQLIVSSSFLVFTLPKLNDLYAQFQVVRPNAWIPYAIGIVVIVAGLINIYLGIKNFQKHKEQEKYFKFGLISAIITFALSGILVSLLTLSVVLPMYNLTESF